MQFQVLSELADVEVIATGKSIREYRRLCKIYGQGRWRKLKGIASIRLGDGTIHLANYIGMKRMASVKKRPKSNAYSVRKKASNPPYVVCVRNDDYPASLELRKIYRLMMDKPASKSGLVRVVDESGEDYLYPADYFVAIKLTRMVERAVGLAS